MTSGENNRNAPAPLEPVIKANLDIDAAAENAAATFGRVEEAISALQKATQITGDNLRIEFFV